ncbi:sigma-70 family RNA polymerase sigma factor, partial [bacterium]|nr:sigma-70 family RNA polymerase sigma factor [bacterium]
MPTNPLSRAVGKVRCALAGAADLPATDGQLVARFVADRGEAAFVALVRRHGPMVLGVCRRVTGDYHAAEDALQATFLVLARRAADIAPPDRVGPWLYGVAWRVARAAQKAERRRSGRERPTGTLPEVAGPEPGDLWD